MPSRAWNWETLRPDYSNVRGFNYVPVYPALFDAPPELPQHLAYYGSASPEATWRFWQRDDVDRQLAYQKGIGCNAVRVFMSHAVWEHEERRRKPGQPNVAVTRFLELVELCEKHRLYLMPVLHTTYSPYAADPAAVPYDGIDIWRRTSSYRDTNVAWGVRNRYDEFVRALARAARDSRAVFMWDLGNEPHESWSEWFSFLAANVRAADDNPNHAITVSYAALPDHLENRVFQDPLIGVVGFHPYGVFRQNIDEWVRMARRHAAPPLSDRLKPVIATEGGSPGIIMAYEDFFRQIRAHNIGFLSWVSVIDDVRGRLPFHYGSGVLFHDGELRDLPAARAMQAFAREDGVLPFELAPLRGKRDLTGWVEPSFSPGTGIDDVLRELHPLRWPSRPRIGFDNFWTDGYVRQRAKLENLLRFGFNVLATIPGQPWRRTLTREEDAILRELDQTHERFDLLTGREYWLTSDDPPDVDWDRYFDFMTRWGVAMWTIAMRNGLRG